MRTNALYTPYGAYELKSLYQRNLTLATLLTASLIITAVVAAWILSSTGQQSVFEVPEIIITTQIDLGPPPSVVRVRPQVEMERPPVKSRQVGIPEPVPDEEILDDDVVIASRDELAEIIPPSIMDRAEDGASIIIDLEEPEYLPPDTAFVPLEIYPEMIYRHVPDYPRLAEQAGITGLVWVKSLVDEEGAVRKAILGKTSGVNSLDQAAVKAAYKCKFKPGIQNGRPVKVWVTYKVEFELTN